MPPSARLCRLSVLLSLLCVLSVAPSPSAAVTVDVSLRENHGPVATQLMEAALVAYAVERPDLDLTASTVPIIEAITNLYGYPATIDFYVSARRVGEPPVAAETALLAANKDIVSFPVAASAVVPIYNLPGVDKTIPLLLTRQHVASIMMGAITWWNDSSIVSLNPNLVLPERPITVVTNSDTITHTMAFMQALNKFDPTFSSVVGQPTDIPIWPTGLYAASLTAAGITGPASVVSATPYTFSYCVISTASALNLPQVAMVNKAAQVVVASTQTINYAFVESGVIVDPTTGVANWVGDLSDGAGLEAWPMTFALACYLPATFARTTCAARSEVIKFWNWFLGSPVVAAIATSLNMAILPPLLYSSLNMNAFLRTTLQCEGAALDAGVTAIIDMGGVSLTSIYSDLVSLYLGFWGATDADFTYTYKHMTELQAVQQLSARELDSAYLVVDQFREAQPDFLESHLAGSDAGGSILTLPYAAYAVVPMHNIPTEVTALYTNWPLVLTEELIGRILVADILAWDHADIEELNPGLANAFVNAGVSKNITLVTCCKAGGSSPVGNALVQSLRVNSPTFAAFRHWSLPVDWTAVITRATQRFMTAISVATEQQMEAAIMRLPGALGYKLSYSNTPDPLHDVSIRKVTPADLSATTFQTRNLQATPSSLAACARAFGAPSISPDFTLMNLAPSKENLASGSLADCWPWNIVGTMAVQNTFSGADCKRGNHTLQMLQWISTAPSLLSSSDTRGILRMDQVSGMSALIVSALNQVTCDGETILITLPIVWKMNAGVTIFAAVLEVFSLLAVAVSAFLLWNYRHRTVLRSSSVPFQFVILVGLAVMFSSLTNFASQPTTPLCQALAWQLNIGFTLMYAPLLLKMWRIYKIFDRRILKVVKITNTKLGSIVAAMVAMDVVINFVWQLYAPVVADAMEVLENGRVHQYMTCTGPPEALPFLILIVSLKCVLLLFGSYMGFTTRNVASTFNESKNVAWAIYNVFFAVAIIVPILFFSQARGDAMTILVVFLIFWISFATFALNFGSKFLVLFKGEDQHNHSVSAGSVDGGGEGGTGAGSQLFSFPSITSLPKQVLDKYIAALETQMRSAKQRHTLLLAENGGVGGGMQFANSAQKPQRSRDGGGGRSRDGGNSGTGERTGRSRDRGTNNSGLGESGRRGKNNSGLGRQVLSGSGAPSGALPVQTGGEAYRVMSEEDTSVEVSQSSRTAQGNTRMGGVGGAWTSLVKKDSLSIVNPTGNGGNGAAAATGPAALTREPSSPNGAKSPTGAGAGSARQAAQPVKFSSRAAQGMHQLQHADGNGEVEMITVSGNTISPPPAARDAQPLLVSSAATSSPAAAGATASIIPWMDDIGAGGGDAVHTHNGDTGNGSEAEGGGTPGMEEQDQ